MASKFGKTWWGEQWLAALSHIDYSNRIPRGARYARNGSVREATIKKGVVSAHVQGSRPSPYKVTLHIPQFPKEQVNALIDKLIKQPSVISALMNRELSPKVMDLATEAGLALFPKQWRDLGMHCSCPDWAVPCKHLAAVIYKISEEIDNNPFLVFELHGVDLPKELSRRGIEMNAKEMLLPIEFEDLTMAPKKVIKRASEYSAFQPDYTTLRDVSKVLIDFLPKSPTFYAGKDFNTLYEKNIKRAQRFASILLTAVPTEKTQSKLSDVISLEVTFNDKLKTVDVHLEPEGGKLRKMPLYDFMINVLEIDDEAIGDYCADIELMHKVIRLGLQLLRHGAIVPQIFHINAHSYGIRWLPAMLCDEVAAIMNDLQKIFPNEILTYSNKAVVDSATWIVSLIINCAIRESLSKQLHSQKIEKMFFEVKPMDFAGVGEVEIPGSIRVWTDRLFLGDTEFCPVFMIDDEENGQFKMTLGAEKRKHSQGSVVPLAHILNHATYASIRYSILKEFLLLSDFLPEISAYIDKDAKHPITFDTSTLLPVLLETIPMMQLLQAKVILPASLKELIHPKVSLQISASDSNGKGFLSVEDLLNFNWVVALGNQQVTIQEFEQLVNDSTGLIRFKDNYIYVTEADLRRLYEAFEDTPKLSSMQLLQIALSGEYESGQILLTPEAKELIARFTTNEQIALPDNLCATMRPYQERGYSWMYRNMHIGFGSIIADDMGLGKTLQVIALLLKTKQEAPKSKFMVVAPTGLLFNWQSEVARFAPTLTVFVYHGANRCLDDFDADILLTSYGIMRSDNALLKKKEWDVMVIDEAQNIKNQGTSQSKAARQIKAKTRIAMSGTPVENRLSEFWSIMEFVNKGYLGSEHQFKKNFANPIQHDGNRIICDRFRAITAPFMMRRLKTDKSIINDLPDKIERNEYVQLTPNQTALYQSIIDRELERITSEDDNFKRGSMILKLLTSLKQVCNHPAQFLKNGDCRAELSGKAVMLLDMIQSIVESKEKVLIFTQYREMGELLVKFITEHLGRKPLFYHGGCSIKQRTDMVERFQNNRNDQVFVLSLKAAGTGLNLTAASNVIHYDLWWNPAVEAQATDRAYRIGQHKNVQVCRFITKGTFEEKIYDMMQDKRHLADITVSIGENWIGSLSNDELSALFEK